MEQKNFPYDAIYKAFFSEKRLVKSFLLDFVRLPFVEGFDLESLELFPANYATPAFKQYENDLVRSVDMKGNACFIFIMLEFQSQPEKWMAARITNYTSLLLNSLITRSPTDITLDNGLPPILPIVVYNGYPRWKAARNVSKLFMPMPRALKNYQPAQKYFLLDVRHIASKIVKDAQGRQHFSCVLKDQKAQEKHVQ